MTDPSVDVQMTDEGVPILLTYRRIYKKPKIKLEQRFVGAGRALRNLWSVLRDFVEEVCFEEERTVLDQGQVRTVHWALAVEDPFEVEETASVVAIRLTQPVPAAMHFEVMQVVHETPVKQESAHAATNGSGPGLHHTS